MSITSANRDLNALKTNAKQACNIFLKECDKRHIPIFVTETHRSQERQDYLYCQGRTVSQCVAGGVPKLFAEKHARSGSQVTWTRNSNHMDGMAWDIAVNPPKELYDANVIAQAGKVARELGIEWGGNWKEKDTPHFQISSSWKAPEPVAPEWQIQALHGMIKKLNLDPEYWTPEKLKNPISIGELMGILNKLPL